MNNWWFIFPFLLTVIGCSKSYMDFDDTVMSEQISLDEFSQFIDGKTRGYSFLETRIIRVYFHFINSTDGDLNYSRDEGLGVITDLLSAANHRMTSNDHMHLPKGNTTPKINAHIQYELATYQGQPGVFHHLDPAPIYFRKKGKKRNLYDRKALQPYAQYQDSVVNVFLMPFDPEQLNSGEQNLEITAVALGTTIKLPGLFQSGRAPSEYAGVFNHEMGHILGLRHTWNVNDGCDDTPMHSNCWNKSELPPCDQESSNNLMDYNAHQSAITPCQIMKMHERISKPGSKARHLVQEDWCKNTPAEKYIDQYELIDKMTILSHDLVVRSKGILVIESAVFLGAGRKIKVQKGGVLILNNALLFSACAEPWYGIQTQKGGKVLMVGDRNQILNGSHVE